MKNRKSAITIIAILSAMHFMTDFICAFVLQMPLGLLADVLKMKREEDSSLLMITAGAVLTVTGLLQAPVWVFGLGNALFHVGGGMITMHKSIDNLLAQGLITEQVAKAWNFDVGDTDSRR